MGYHRGLPCRSFKFLVLFTLSFRALWAYHVAADLSEISHHSELIAHVQIAGSPHAQWSNDGHAETQWPVHVIKILKGRDAHFLRKKDTNYIVTKGGSPSTPPPLEAIKHRPILKKCSEELCGEMIFNSGSTLLNKINFQKNEFIVFLNKNGKIMNEQSIVEIQDGNIDSSALRPLNDRLPIVGILGRVSSQHINKIPKREFEKLIQITILQKHDEKNCRFMGHEREKK
ncbi:MAG: hypothetical protein HYS98_06960 [Deltaproteobacteria bacterium]|nr:hypothetical protein [Deltaproteobacteria bacterium]